MRKALKNKADLVFVTAPHPIRVDENVEEMSSLMKAAREGINTARQLKRCVAGAVHNLSLTVLYMADGLCVLQLLIRMAGGHYR